MVITGDGLMVRLECVSFTRSFLPSIRQQAILRSSLTRLCFVSASKSFYWKPFSSAVGSLHGELLTIHHLPGS